MPQDVKHPKHVGSSATQTLNTRLVFLEHGQQPVGGFDRTYAVSRTPSRKKSSQASQSPVFPIGLSNR